MTFSLQARIVFPVDQPAIEHGVVTIEGDRIVAVGSKPSAGDVTDLGDVALTPGLVNAHTHLEFSNLSQPLGKPGMRLVDWIRLVIAERSSGSLVSGGLSLASGMQESTHGGTTLLGNIAVGPPGFVPGTVPTTVFAEVIGFSRARAASAFTDIEQRLYFMRNSLSCRHANTIDSVRFGISPHAPYTVSPRLIEMLVTLARDDELPVAMHLAESEEELELLHATGPFQELLDERSMWDAEAIPRGSRPIDYLQMLAESPRALVIHGNYLNDEERAFLAAHADRMSLVYCPRTHAYFRHPPYPLPQLLAAGVHVALGTDSRASNPDLDLFAEMRYVTERFPKIDRHDILRMGTLSGAEALGRADGLGSITPGKLANLVAIPLPASVGSNTDSHLSAIMTDDSTARRTVWLRGKQMP